MIMVVNTKPILRNVSVVVLLVAMAAVAEMCGQKEVVFPEAAALCVGLWLMPKAVWNVRGWQVPVLLTIAALVGLATNLLVPACLEVRFVLAFVVVIGLLRLVKCNMFPVVSAAMLPVLMGTTSWTYPVAVLVIALLLAVGHHCMGQEERTEYHPFGWRQLAMLTAALCIILVVEASANKLFFNYRLSTLHFVAVPPLVVTMIEFANRRSGFRKRPWMIWGLTVIAASLGSAMQWLVHELWGLPMAIGTVVVVSAMLLLFKHYKPFAPSLAIAVVPLLLPTEVLPWFPLLVAIGSAWFIVAGMWIGDVKCKNGNPQCGAASGNDGLLQ